VNSLKGCGIGLVALLTGAIALIVGILSLSAGLFPSPKVGPLELLVGIPSCVLGLLVGVLFFRGIARAFGGQRSYLGMGLLSAFLIPFLFFGVCTMFAG